MIRGRVQGVEAMEFGFHVRSIGEGKAEPPKDPDSLVQQASKRMDGSQVAARAWQRDVNRGEFTRICRSLQRLLLLFEQGRDPWRRLFNSLPTRGRSSLRSRACLH